MWKKAKRGMNHEPILKNLRQDLLRAICYGRSYGITVLELEVGSIGVYCALSHNHQ